MFQLLRLLHLNFLQDTPIVPFKVKVVLAGLPMVPIDRIAKTIFVSATDPDMSTSGSAYVLLDDGLAMRLEPDVIKTGVYKVMDARAAFAEKYVLVSKLGLGVLIHARPLGL